jgi:hypothetical protein
MEKYKQNLMLSKETEPIKKDKRKSSPLYHAVYCKGQYDTVDTTLVLEKDDEVKALSPI